MRNGFLYSVAVLVGGFVLSPLAFAQSQSGTPAFDPRDFNGVYTAGGGGAPAAARGGAAGNNAAAPAGAAPAGAPAGAPPAGARGGAPAGGAAALANQHPPFTPWAQARFDAAIPSGGARDIPGKENDPTLKCDPDGFPKIMGSPEPWEIVMTPKRMFEFFEKDHIWREIWLDGRELPKDPDPTWNGNSVGHWEGDTLVVESNGFNDITWLDYQGDPHSEQMTMIERYTKVGPDTLKLEIAITDPKAYTAPWVFRPRMITRRPGWELHEWYCTQDDTQSYDSQIRVPSGQPAK